MKKWTYESPIRYILIVGFLLRVGIAYFDHLYKILPYAWDDYYTTGVQIKSNLINGYQLFYRISEAITVKSYAMVNAAVFTVFGNYE